MAEQLLDGGFESISDFPRQTQSVNPTWPYLIDGSGATTSLVSPWFHIHESGDPSNATVASANARSGSQHWRVTGPDTFSPILHWGSQSVQGLLSEATQGFGDGLVATPISEGDVWAASVWVATDGDFPGFSNFVELQIYQWDTSENHPGELVTDTFTTTNTSGAYVELSLSGTIAATVDTPNPEYLFMKLEMQLSGTTYVVDVDDASLDIASIPTVLYVSHTGFRFPYPRWT